MTRQSGAPSTQALLLRARAASADTARLLRSAELACSSATLLKESARKARLASITRRIGSAACRRRAPTIIVGMMSTSPSIMEEGSPAAVYCSALQRKLPWKAAQIEDLYESWKSSPNPALDQLLLTLAGLITRASRFPAAIARPLF